MWLCVCTQVEIKMRKAEGFHWTTLERKEDSKAKVIPVKVEGEEDTVRVL